MEIVDRGVSWLIPEHVTSIVDDFEFLMFTCGNDFIPQIPFVAIHSNYIQWLLDIYARFLNEKKRFVVENCSIHFDSFLYFIKEISLQEQRLYSENENLYLLSLRKLATWKADHEENSMKKEFLSTVIEKCNSSLPFDEYRQYYYSVKLDMKYDGFYFHRSFIYR